MKVALIYIETHLCRFICPFHPPPRVLEACRIGEDVKTSPLRYSILALRCRRCVLVDDQAFNLTESCEFSGGAVLQR